MSNGDPKGSSHLLDVVTDTVKTVEQKIAFWGAIAKFVGWPGMILLAMGWGIYCASGPVWSLCLRIGDAHVVVVTGLLEQQKEMVNQQKAQNELKEESNRILEKVSTEVSDNNHMLQDLHKVIVKPPKE